MIHLRHFVTPPPAEDIMIVPLLERPPFRVPLIEGVQGEDNHLRRFTPPPRAEDKAVTIVFYLFVEEIIS